MAQIRAMPEEKPKSGGRCAAIADWAGVADIVEEEE